MGQQLKVTSKEATKERSKMGIFADIDIDDIPDNPFGVPAGTYRTICTDAKYIEKDDVTSLTITWTVDEPDNGAHGNNISKWYTLYPGVKSADLTPEQKKYLSFLKLMLREGFGLSESEIATVEPSDLIGTVVYVTVVENQGKGDNAGKTYTNVKSAMCERLYNENRQAMESVGASFGI